MSIRRFTRFAFTLVIVTLIAGISACDQVQHLFVPPDEVEDNVWVGDWELQTIDGASLEEHFESDFEGIDLSVVSNRWTFHEDETWDMEIGIDFKVAEAGIAITSSTIINFMGTYSLSGSNYTLSFMSHEENGFFGSDELDTGTWLRDGATLILYSDGDIIVVFKLLETQSGQE